MAGRAGLQVDQAAPSDQAVVRHDRERGEDADLDRRLDLRARRIVRERLKIQASLYEMLQILSLTMCEKTLWDTLFSQIRAGQNDADAPN